MPAISMTMVGTKGFICRSSSSVGALVIVELGVLGLGDTMHLWTVGILDLPLDDIASLFPFLCNLSQSLLEMLEVHLLCLSAHIREDDIYVLLCEFGVRKMAVVAKLKPSSTIQFLTTSLDFCSKRQENFLDSTPSSIVLVSTTFQFGSSICLLLLVPAISVTVVRTEFLICCSSPSVGTPC